MKAMERRIKALETGTGESVSLALKEWLGLPLTAQEQALFDAGKVRRLGEWNLDDLPDDLREWHFLKTWWRRWNSGMECED